MRISNRCYICNMLMRSKRIQGVFDVDGREVVVELKTMMEAGDDLGISEQQVNHLVRTIDEETGDGKLNYTRINLEFSKKSSNSSKQQKMILIDEKYRAVKKERLKRVEREEVREVQKSRVRLPR